LSGLANAPSWTLYSIRGNGTTSGWGAGRGARAAQLAERTSAWAVAVGRQTIADSTVHRPSLLSSKTVLALPSTELLTPEGLA
jgi:hypothetical protein